MGASDLATGKDLATGNNSGHVPMQLLLLYTLVKLSCILGAITCTCGATSINYNMWLASLQHELGVFP